MKKRMAKNYKKRCFLSLDDNYLSILISDEQKGKDIYQKVLIEDLKQSNHQLIQMLATCSRYLILSPDYYRLLTLSRPDVPDKFLNDAVKWQLVEKLSFNVSTAYINFTFTDESKNNLLVSASAADKFNAIMEKFKHLGLTLQAVFPEDIIFSHLSTLFKERNSVIIRLHSEKLSLMLVKNHHVHDIVYFPNVHDDDLLSKVSLIIKTLLEKHEIKLSGLPVFYSNLKENAKDGHEFEQLFSSWNAVFYDIAVYVRKQAGKEDVDNSYAALFIAMRYTDSHKMDKGDLNFLGHTSSKRISFHGIGKYLNYGLIIAVMVVVVMEVKKVVTFFSANKQLTALVREKASEQNKGEEKSNKEQLMLRIDPQAISNNHSLYEWLLPLSQSIQKGVWMNAMVIDQQKGVFEISGQALSSQGIMRFADQLEKSSLYKNMQLKVGKAEEKDEEASNYDDQKKKTPISHLLLEDWTISHPDAENDKKKETSSDDVGEH